MTAGILFFVFSYYEYIMLGISLLFIFQFTWVLSANIVLHNTLTKTFDAKQLANERRFLKCTLIVFSISYFFAVVRTTSIFSFVALTDDKVLLWVCNNNFEANMLNCVSWFLIDLLPVGTIFFLHWRNYRKESMKQQAMVVDRDREYDTSISASTQDN